MSREIKLIPELRFPEFVNQGEWGQKKLGDIFLQRNEIGFTDLPLLSLTDKYGIIPHEDTNRKNKSNSDKSKYLRVCPGDVAYNTMRMWEGRSAYVNIEGLVSPAYTVCKPKKGNIGLFFSYYFKTSQLIQEFFRFSQGLVKDTLSLKYEKFSQISIFKPTILEQQKIASCLVSLDELIAAHSDKLGALKDHKKGLMQNLFPQEGEKVSKYRFPEFVNDGEWEEKKLGDCLINKPEYGINAPAVPYSDKLPTYLRITDISEDGDFLSNKKVSVDRDISEDKYLSDGDIVLVRTGASVGKSYKYRKKDGKLVFAGFLIRVRPDTKKLDPELLFQFLSTSQYWKWVNFVSARSGQPGINGTEYSSMPISLPPQLKEQQKIASCFSAIDELITAQAEKIEQLKLHKKGLMQGLFPKKK